MLMLLFFVVNSIITSFAQQTMGLFQNDNTSFNGYTLIAPFNSFETYLIDNCGFVVNKWENSTYQAGAWTYLLEDGSIMRTCRVQGNFMTGGSGGRLEQYDWDDNLVWSYDIADSTQQQHHDIEILPNGNILMLHALNNNKEPCITEEIRTGIKDPKIFMMNEKQVSTIIPPFCLSMASLKIY